MSAFSGTPKKPGMSSTSNGKRITFAPGTAPPKETRVALTISKHETSSIGVTAYLVDVWQSGFCWMVRKRYKDFVSLHTRVAAELAKFSYDLPVLPKKRWFESQRWINKLDPVYVDTRRFALEAYLRILVRLPLLLERCQAVRNFLNLKKVQDNFAVEEFEYQQNKMGFIRFYEVDDGEIVENNIYHTESNEDDEEDGDEPESERFSAAIAAANVDGAKDNLMKRLESLVNEGELLSPGPGGGAAADSENNSDEENGDRRRTKSASAAELLAASNNSRNESRLSLDAIASPVVTAAVVAENVRLSDQIKDSTKQELLFTNPRANINIDVEFQSCSLDTASAISKASSQGPSVAATGGTEETFSSHPVRSKVARVKVDSGDPLA